MDRIPPFDAQMLEAACKVLADTEKGLTGSEIGYLIQDCNMEDPNPTMTKWKRLFNSMVGVQNKHQVGNHLIMFINRALNPVSYARDREKFEWRKNELNVVLAFSGYEVREEGKVAITNKAETLSEARARANSLRAVLEERGAHLEVFKYCKSELLENNYFHAVLEAIKGIAERIRKMTGLPGDGADLVKQVFSVKNPIMRINNLITDTEKSEQSGFANILIGLFGAVRNPAAHAPKVYWPMTKEDALDILGLISYIHRKIDNAEII